MNIPAFLLGASLLFWGWQTGWLILALPMALSYEAARFISWRWNFSNEDFKQISKLCALLAISVLVYLLTTNRSVYLMFAYFKWLPILCLPILLAQAYSTSHHIPIRTLFFFLPNKKDQRVIALPYPYFAICLLSASAGNVRDFSFYIGMFVLVSVALWFVRSSRFSPIIWICLLLIAGSLGIGGHMALHRFQITLEQNTVEWFSSFYQPDADPLQRSTAIGDIGSVKLSNRIVFRVKPDVGQIEPELLRRATYNKYISGMWAASKSQFAPIVPESNGIDWHLTEKYPQNSTITISTALNQEKQLLNLPDGTFQINRLPIEAMEKSQYGTVKVTGKPGTVSYQVQFAEDLSIDSPPTKDDLQIPEREKQALNQIISQLDLAEKPPQEILQIVQNFFQREFRYSLKLANQGYNSTPLSAFLLDHRSGHCEYFATATTLLLRAVGIPTRYAIGYSVHEFSRLENQFIVRDRNAHAWTMVYINDRWQVLDTTPADWISIEDKNSPKWKFIFDILSWCWFKLSQLLNLSKQLGNSRNWLWLTIPAFFVLWRWFSYYKQVKSNKKIAKTQKTNYAYAGEDSEFYLIEKALKELGFTRDRSETLRHWIERVQDNLPTSDLANELRSILELHYRYRFDPQGIKITERDKLKSNCRLWLSKYQKAMESKTKIEGEPR